MALSNMERPQPKHNEHAHDKDEQESTGLDAMQKNKDLATLSTGSHATKDAVNNVLTTPELLLMVLSHLEIKDLTRALSVSKYWHQTILGAIELRQTLFLTPKADVEEFFNWEPGELEWVPLIVREPTPDSRPIIKLHPVLQPDPRARLCLDMYQRHRSLKTVSPSTFLTQPPVKEVKLEQELFTEFGHVLAGSLKREEGVTFGDVVEEIEALRAREISGGGFAGGGGFGRGLSNACRDDDDDDDDDSDNSDDDDDDAVDLSEGEDEAFHSAPMGQEALLAEQDWHYTRIEASGVVAEASRWVLAARETLEQELKSSESVSPGLDVHDCT